MGVRKGRLEGGYVLRERFDLHVITLFLETLFHMCEREKKIGQFPL